MKHVGFLAAMFAALVLAAPASAQGRDSSDKVPEGHRPPPGMCRIWLDGVPAGRQPAPTDCPTAIKRRPPNARVIFGDPVAQPQPRQAKGKPSSDKKDPDGTFVRKLNDDRRRPFDF